VALDTIGSSTDVQSAPARCSNCDAVLDGPCCARCGQEAVNLHLPFSQFISEVIDDALSLDRRLVRTLRPLLFRPGLVTRDYLLGRRGTHVPPLRAYLISALIFFGLFSIFPNRARVEVFTTEETTSDGGGSRLSFEFPAHMPINDTRYQELVARAKANPDDFARAAGAAVPRIFFLFLPIFAGLLKLFYRRQGYYLDHLVFSLYYHAFVFVVFSLLFLMSRSDQWLPGFVRTVIGVGLLVWVVAYLPIALRRVYGGSNRNTLFKLAGLGVTYLALFTVIGIPLVMFIGLSTF
jgi:Protein of unknown function (DUF3667)